MKIRKIIAYKRVLTNLKIKYRNDIENKKTINYTERYFYLILNNLIEQMSFLNGYTASLPLYGDDDLDLSVLQQLCEKYNIKAMSGGNSLIFFINLEDLVEKELRQQSSSKTK